MKKYFINFWLWWYVIEAGQVARNLINMWSFTLGYFNVVPMARNLFVPLYQDYSAIGYAISFPIRLIWITVGSIMQLFVTVPLLLLFLMYLVLPLIPVFQLLRYLSNAIT
ncbi:MAG: hypothetical protein TR69_WS6001000814 [candidate division WS6 bacterium OLB20]|uniref:Uncharacterized protein n=1 Tax=candidate division WS6 bacterium OLB20 TaxID=1617426 RepID=A0A136LYS1_9BACT|nr:MAG: hypothetical protein TR69_WS6001000814 [candidate division WS6 bacterium OLB20]